MALLNDTEKRRLLRIGLLLARIALRAGVKRLGLDEALAAEAAAELHGLADDLKNRR